MTLLKPTLTFVTILLVLSILLMGSLGQTIEFDESEFDQAGYSSDVDIGVRDRALFGDEKQIIHNRDGTDDLDYTDDDDARTDIPISKQIRERTFWRKQHSDEMYRLKMMQQNLKSNKKSQKKLDNAKRKLWKARIDAQRRQLKEENKIRKAKLRQQLLETKIKRKQIKKGYQPGIQRTEMQEDSQSNGEGDENAGSDDEEMEPAGQIRQNNFREPALDRSIVSGGPKSAGANVEPAFAANQQVQSRNLFLTVALPILVLISLMVSLGVAYYYRYREPDVVIKSRVDDNIKENIEAAAHSGESQTSDSVA